MSENKDKLKMGNENFSSISGQGNKLSKDTPATVKDFFYYGRCPRCGNNVEVPDEIFCPRCGQALLWPSFPETGRKSAEDSSEVTEEEENWFCLKDPGNLHYKGPFKDNA